MATKVRNRAAQDATLINVRAMKRQLVKQDRALKLLTTCCESLIARVASLEMEVMPLFAAPAKASRPRRRG